MANIDTKVSQNMVHPLLILLFYLIFIKNGAIRLIDVLNISEIEEINA